MTADKEEEEEEEEEEQNGKERNGTARVILERSALTRKEP